MEKRMACLLVVLVMVAVFSSGCATLLGGAVGGLLGGTVAGPHGAVIGAAGGALIGATVDMQNGQFYPPSHDGWYSSSPGEQAAYARGRADRLRRLQYERERRAYDRGRYGGGRW